MSSDETKPEPDNKAEATAEAKADDVSGETKEKDGDTEMKEDKESDAEAKKKEEELRKKYADWPMKEIKEPHENDVMYGRGGGTNHHPGNKRYRQWVEDRKLEYVNSKRLDKPLVALEIIRKWRAQIPSGRFLKLDEKTGLWFDVGDKKAREKTSQALREKAPLIRKQQEEEDKQKDDEPGTPKKSKNDEVKSTRFAEGTKKESGQIRKAVLARDHSLGREYIQPGEQVSLEGFSWQDPFQGGARKNKPNMASHPSPPPPPPPHAAYPPAGRNSSHGSLGMAPPHHTSIGAPPPPPDYWGRVPSDDRQRQFSTGRIESWGSAYPYPPPPPPGMHGSMHQRSGSWTHPPPPPPPPPHGRHQRSGSWTSGREHSLSFNPLNGASVSQPADRGAFDSGRSSSAYWGEPVPSPPPPPGGYGNGPRIASGGSMGPYRQPLSPSHSMSPANSTPSPKPPYSVDMSIAKTWSGGEVRKTWSGEQDSRKPWPGGEYDGQPQPVPGGDNSPMRGGGHSSLPRPQMVKRDTSHQNENYETKPSVKRAALNRDNSLASNRLKNQYMPEFYNIDTDKEMKRLSSNFEQQSSLGTEAVPPKPKAIGEGERQSTMDFITKELLAKPEPLLPSDRVSTLDALDIDFKDDPVMSKEALTSSEQLAPPPVAKPEAITPGDRLTTQDVIDLVNTPLSLDELPASKSDDDRGDGPLALNQEKIAEEWLTQV